MTQFQVLSLLDCFQYIFVTQYNAMYAENLHCDKLSVEAISRVTVWKIRLFGTTLPTRMKGSVWFFSLQETCFCMIAYSIRDNSLETFNEYHHVLGIEDKNIASAKYKSANEWLTD